MSSGEPMVDRMREQAQRAISSSKSRNVILPLLERLARAASPGSEPSTFAHRHLAEYLVEQHPWRALLHLRQVMGRQGIGRHGNGKAEARHVEAEVDDGAHALAGLAHALLGNYRSAVEAYRRAIAIAPQNPWYQHNLGHLLDVGLDRPKAARRHLEAAHRGAGPDDGEVSASLAHCLARLGELTAALAHAEVAARTSPDNPEHQRLRAWIVDGAPEADDTRTRKHTAPSHALEGVPHAVVPTHPGNGHAKNGDPANGNASGPGSARPRNTRPSHGSGGHGRPDEGSPSHGSASHGNRRSASPSHPEASDRATRTTSVGTLATDPDTAPARRKKTKAAAFAVAALLRDRMGQARCAPADVERAIKLWDEYRVLLKVAEIRGTDPSTWAAMVDVASADLGPTDASGKPVRSMTLTVAARRYGVKTEALRARWALLLTHWSSLPGPWAGLSDQLDRRTRDPRHARR